MSLGNATSLSIRSRNKTIMLGPIEGGGKRSLETNAKPAPAARYPVHHGRRFGPEGARERERPSTAARRGQGGRHAGKQGLSISRELCRSGHGSPRRAGGTLRSPAVFA